MVCMRNRWVLTKRHLTVIVLCSVVFGAHAILLALTLAAGIGLKAISQAVVAASMALIVYSILRSTRHSSEQPEA
jgi:hypothetical protein